MQPYSTSFREKVVQAYQVGNTSVRKVAARFDVSKAFVQKMLKQQEVAGHLTPGKPGGGMKGKLAGREVQLAEMVEQHPDATLVEYCEYWGETHQQWVSASTMCRALQKAELTRKKRLYAARKPRLNESKSYAASTGSK
ncbi:transposase [Phormidesmis priestleyi ULC007]|uniref:Transposase n=1 Tax=Phormidesmis priestleyi ULC007 TaxID=1920490 RepID=A0A2T1DB32_9CYAN|nr:IS630 transposase-related protein [Phormidesmis priestleyi]PSB17667.1 transposase [Phormidesmis priestleyi ULC007]